MSNPKPSDTSVPDEAALGAAMAARLRQALVDAVVGFGAGEPMDRPALTVERSPVPIAPTRLAASAPRGAAREEARLLYERCLAHYRESVRPQDLALGIDDVGAAVAAFVAANLSALHGDRVDPATLLALEQQLGGVVRITADWDRAPARERQAYFEKMAVLAVLISESAAQARVQGAAAIANVQQAARGYVQELLGLNPDHLAIGPGGLTARAV